MAEIARYVAKRSLEPAAAPDTQVSGALASALQSFGGAISDLEGAFLQKKQQREDFKAQNDYRRLQLELDDELKQRSEAMEPGGEGFHDSYLNDVYKPKRQAFLDALPERLRPKFQTVLADPDPTTGAGGEDFTRWSIKAAETERDEVYRWAGEQLTVSREQLATAVSLNPDEYDTLLKTGMDEIDSAPIPAVQKDKFKREWETMAQVAHLNRLLEEDPENVIKELGADPRYLSPTTQFDMLARAVEWKESGGDPNALSPKGAIGLRQIMPATAREIAGELKDKNFDFGWDETDVRRYLSNPVINRKYGDYYLRKQLRAYNGDIEAALIAYNGGPARADAWLKANRDDSVLPAETRDYYKKITARLTGGKPAAGSPERAKFSGADLTTVSKDLVDRVATAFTAVGVDNIRVTSGFRSPEKNEEVGGAKHSQHMHGNAVDIDVSGLPIAKRIEIIRSLSASGVTGLGIGSNIIHADLGGRRAWGYVTSAGGGEVPKWAKAAIDEHLSGTSKAPSVAGRYSSLPYDQRQKFISAADNAITQRYNQSVKADAAARVDLRRAMDNELASLRMTGTSTGFDDTSVATVLGEDDYMRWADNKAKAQRMFTATQGIATMTPDEMSVRIEDYKAQPGSPTFAADAEVEKAVQAEIERVQKLRAKSPDKAALAYPEVKQAYDDVKNSMLSGEPSPDEVQRFVRLMLDKQAEFDIAPEARAPVPREWALEIGRSLTRVPEAQGKNLPDVQAAIAVQYLALQQYFGDMTDEVILYALSEYKGLSKPTSDMIGGYMKAIALGGDPLRLNADKVLDQGQVEGMNGRNWFQSARDWLFGDDGEEPGDAAPRVDPLTGQLPPEMMRRVIDQLDGATPEEEAMIVDRYGQAAVDAARSALQGAQQ